MISPNLLGGYTFAYPRTWTVAEAGAQTELASPDGETRVSFSSSETRLIGDGGGEHSRGQALLRFPPVNRGAIGARYGMAGDRRRPVLPRESDAAGDSVGRWIHFPLVIGIPGERPTHAI